MNTFDISKFIRAAGLVDNGLGWIGSWFNFQVVQKSCLSLPPHWIRILTIIMQEFLP